VRVRVCVCVADFLTCQLYVFKVPRLAPHVILCAGTCFAGAYTVARQDLWRQCPASVLQALACHYVLIYWI
jgi:hypothetical protein